MNAKPEQTPQLKHNALTRRSRWLRYWQPELRHGQSLWIALCETDKAKADQLRDTDADCFYNDNNIPAFWAAL